jgi:hypothetical protein
VRHEQIIATTEKDSKPSLLEGVLLVSENLPLET